MLLQLDPHLLLTKRILHPPPGQLAAPVTAVHTQLNSRQDVMAASISLPWSMSSPQHALLLQDFRVPIEVDIFLWGFDGDGAYGFKLDVNKLQETLTTSFMQHCPAVWEEQEQLSTCLQVQTTIQHVDNNVQVSHTAEPPSNCAHRAGQVARHSLLCTGPCSIPCRPLATAVLLRAAAAQQAAAMHAAAPCICLLCNVHPHTASHSPLPCPPPRSGAPGA